MPSFKSAWKLSKIHFNYILTSTFHLMYTVFKREMNVISLHFETYKNNNFPLAYTWPMLLRCGKLTNHWFFFSIEEYIKIINVPYGWFTFHSNIYFEILDYIVRKSLEFFLLCSLFLTRVKRYIFKYIMFRINVHNTSCGDF